ncbi:hypothetical protein EGW08_004999 [Elysia chlorotica]|uniref:Nuclear receptor domain-containing protein n=1 Tax=Elysia chlorotica TaxID=188477 RepID=A0A3S0ZUT7_ELYCH|nr:hypothetical protein EGW08_004999 [Elysia chlorotica]
MGRKRKVFKLEQEFKQRRLLPPCRVCEGPAGGFHYGVNTCEACKGFFHRCLNKKEEMKCNSEGKCPVLYTIPNICKKCRYAKCLAVGMTKQAIKTGRYTVEKRTRDILEIKTLRERRERLETNRHRSEDITLQSNSQKSLTAFTNLEDSQQSRKFSTSQSADTDGSHLAFHYDASADGLEEVSSDNTCTSQTVNDRYTSQTFNDIYTSQTVNDRYTPPTVNDTYTSLTFNDRHTSQTINDKYTSQTVNDRYTSQTINDMYTSQAVNYRYTSETINDRYTSQTVNDRYTSQTVNDRYTSQTVNDRYTSKPTHNGCENISAQNISPPSEASYSTSRTIDRYSPSSHHEALPNIPQIDDRDICDYNQYNNVHSHTVSRCPGGFECSQSTSLQAIYELYRRKDVVVESLVQARNEHIKHLLPNRTREELYRTASEHMETCKLRREIFGNMARLPDQDYDSIYANTGLDVDGRRQTYDGYLMAMEMCIRAYAKFAKCVPGFNHLRMKEKISLIKYSRNEFLFFMDFINSESQGVIFCIDQNARCKRCAHILGQTEMEQRMDQLLFLHRTFLRLKLTLEEKVVSAAVALMAPDRENHIKSEKVTMVYELLNDCLLHLFQKRCSKPLQMYAKVTDILVSFRSYNYEGFKCIKKQRLDKYSNLLDNPALREMFGGIFFDDFDDSETDAQNDDCCNT